MGRRKFPKAVFWWAVVFALGVLAPKIGGTVRFNQLLLGCTSVEVYGDGSGVVCCPPVDTNAGLCWFPETCLQPYLEMWAKEVLWQPLFYGNDTEFSVTEPQVQSSLARVWFDPTNASLAMHDVPTPCFTSQDCLKLYLALVPTFEGVLWIKNDTRESIAGPPRDPLFQPKQTLEKAAQ